MSNKNVIPAESLGQWRSWTMGEIGVAANVVTTEVASPPTVEEPETQPEEPPVEGAFTILDAAEAEDEQEPPLAVATAFPTAAELEAIHQEAWQAGYDAGLKAGEEQGRAEGAERALVEAQAQFQQYWEPLSSLQQAFEGELAALGAQLSQDVLALALSFAEKLVGQAVQQNPAILQPLLSEALDSLSETVQQVKVQVHPEELATLQAFLGEGYPQWRMQWVPNDSLLRGGCRIETASTEIDLTLDNRIALLREGLGVRDERAD